MSVWLIGGIITLSACSSPIPGIATPVPGNAENSSPSPKAPTLKATQSISPTATPIPTSQLNLQADDLRGTIIHYWHPWSGPAGQVMQALIDQFNLTNEWGIVIVPERQSGPDTLYENLNAALRGGQAADIGVGQLHQALAWDAASGLVDLESYVDDPVWGFSPEEQADFYPVFWEQDVVDGKRIGIPAQRAGQLLFYNRTWARELGFQIPPASPEQFADQACAAARSKRRDADPENDSSGGWIISTQYPAVLSWIYAFGGEILMTPKAAPEQSVYQFDDAKIEGTFAFLRDLYERGCAWLPPSDYPEAEFAGRLGLFSTGSVVDLPYQAEAFARAENNDEWTVIPFPSPSLEPAIDVYGPSFSIFKTSPERQLASWLFIKWLLSPDHQKQFIEATGSFPLSAAALTSLGEYKNRHPQWTAAVEVLPTAHSEPAFQSWSTVRWALSEAATQLFRSYFTMEQLPNLLSYLDLTAAELHLGPERSGVFDTPTHTPAPSATATITPTPSHTPTLTRTPRAAPAGSATPAP